MSLCLIMVFPLGMGIKGASIATSISCIAGGCMVLVYFLFFSNQLKFYRLKCTWKSFKLTVRNVGYMARIGFATFLQELAMGIMMITGNYMFLSRLGEDGVAAFSVGCYLFPIIFSISNAVAQSSQPIISFNYGAKNMERVGRALRIALGTAVISGLLITLCMWTGSPLLSMVFLPADSDAYAIASKGLPLLGLCALFFAVNITFIGYYQSIEKVVISTVYSMLRGIIFVIPAFLFLPGLIGDIGLWLSIPFAEMVTMLTIVAVYFARKL
ncbi:MAG: hypothetical protein K2M27_03425 [Muribaculaceae bacterium]|nr:hypothetical protein [Muribaculaceae bacterium]